VRWFSPRAGLGALAVGGAPSLAVDPQVLVLTWQLLLLGIRSGGWVCQARLESAIACGDIVDAEVVHTEGEALIAQVGGANDGERASIHALVRAEMEAAYGVSLSKQRLNGPPGPHAIKPLGAEQRSSGDVCDSSLLPMPPLARCRICRKGFEMPGDGFKHPAAAILKRRAAYQNRGQVRRPSAPVIWLSMVFHKLAKYCFPPHL